MRYQITFLSMRIVTQGCSERITRGLRSRQPRSGAQSAEGMTHSGSVLFANTVSAISRVLPLRRSSALVCEPVVATIRSPSRPCVNAAHVSGSGVSTWRKTRKAGGAEVGRLRRAAAGES